MKVEEYKLSIGHLKGEQAPKCSNCAHALKTKGLRCMRPSVVEEIGGFATKPDAWCPEYAQAIKKEGSTW